MQNKGSQDVPSIQVTVMLHVVRYRAFVYFDKVSWLPISKITFIKSTAFHVTFVSGVMSALNAALCERPTLHSLIHFHKRTRLRETLKISRKFCWRMKIWPLMLRPGLKPQCILRHRLNYFAASLFTVLGIYFTYKQVAKSTIARKTHLILKIFQLFDVLVSKEEPQLIKRNTFPFRTNYCNLHS